ncbi:MAG: type VII toxin-antitoxin system HepT family RNase toxin [Desulfuromonadaceae bacterium]
MVDKALVFRKVASLSEYQKQVSEYSALTVEQYRGDWKIQRIVERTLQMMIELCADIANHVISDNGLRTPETYADTFRVLAENNILAPDKLAVMEKMSKFRNIVVHQYETVDAEIVILVLRRHLDDFRQFSDSVIQFINRK